MPSCPARKQSISKTGYIKESGKECVIKKTTGDAASSHIRQFVIQLAKNGLAAGETVSQVSDRLSFEYPQHFSRMFKKQEGVTPSEYCQRVRG